MIKVVYSQSEERFENSVNQVIDELSDEGCIIKGKKYYVTQSQCDRDVRMGFTAIIEYFPREKTLTELIGDIQKGEPKHEMECK